jgi:transposase
VTQSMLVATWHILTTGEVYRDPGGDYFANRDPERQTRRLVAHLEKLGHVVTLEPATSTATSGVAT